MPERPPTIGLTRWSAVALAAVVGAGVSWLVGQILLVSGRPLPLLGPLAWLPIGLLAAWIGWLGYRTRRDIRERRDLLDASVAVTRLNLGKTSLLAGVGLGAGYLVLIAMAAGGWPAPLAQTRVLHGAIAVLGCAAWAWAGWRLERACRVMPGDDEDPTDEVNPQ